MRYLSLFSGIEAASVAWLPLGWECVGVAEIEKFPSAVLKTHYPEVPNLGDITKITDAQIRALGPIDLVVGGFPCQDVSQAGKRKGLRNEDGSPTRSGLFFDAMRLVRAADPRWLVIENVPGLYSSNAGRDFAAVVGEILGITIDVPRDGWARSGAAASKRGMVEWSLLDAQFRGLAQRRERVFLVADFGDWASRPPVLLEQESMLGNPAPGRETRQDVAGTLSSRSTAGGGLGTDFDLGGGSSQPDGVMPANPLEGGVSHALTARHSATGRYDPNGETFVAHTLTGGGFDASEDGTGRGTPLVATVMPLLEIGKGSSSRGEGPNGSGFGKVGDPMFTLQAGAQHGVAITGTLVANGKAAGSATSQDAENGFLVFDETQVTSKTNRSQPRAGDPSHPLAAGARAPTIAFNGRQDPDVSGDKTHPLDTDGHSIAMALPTMTVRRITPKEACRLQGFPDDYLDITYRKKPAADGPKYRALGNSFAVPVVAWIGEQIDMAMKASKPTVVRKKKRLLTDKRCEHCGHVTRWPCKSTDAIAICDRKANPKA